MRTQKGFTLIELSIVLVIIGLIIGGILVGRDLIKAAELRATIAQIEKYTTAVNTFRSKYNAVPGDMNAVLAAQLGFPPFDVGVISRSGTQGRGDGNGILDAFTTSVITNPSASLSGEISMFWGDLSSAGLIDGSFIADQIDFSVAPSSNITLTSMSNYLPSAKLGQGNFVTVYAMNGLNYFNILAIQTIIAPNSFYGSIPGMQTQQAYNIDKKIDDGLPQSGRVTAQYVNNSSLIWAGVSDTSPVSQGLTTCYDNGGISGTQQYSLGTVAKNGDGKFNCALSFQFQ